LAAFYIDNYGYQENILPKIHKLQGHEVAILASTETYVDGGVLGYLKPSSYFTKEGIPITRLPYFRWLPHFIAKKLRIYEGISKAVEQFKPDIIFIHDCQFVGIKEIVSYAKKNSALRIYVDGHTDFINSARTWLSRRVLHGIIYKWCAKIILPYTRKFYGVLPLRVDFFKSVYGIPDTRVELLVLGADDSIVDLSRKDEIRSAIRKKLNISENDFVIVSGGKIDNRKNIHVLMKAVSELTRENIKLIIFGSPTIDMKNEIEELAKCENIRYLGWINSEQVYDYFLASDLGFFPGTHSVLWEQAVGVGLPCVFKRWEGIQHIDVGGNCTFINSDSVDVIKNSIIEIVSDYDLYFKMKKVAIEVGVPVFSYSQIAKRAIEEAS
jgi:1,2-diacylglycerol 3-alpha-glucosyltransferase